MSSDSTHNQRPIDLSDSGLVRLGQTLWRGVLRRCPYCGGDKIFNNWFSLKERCPHCNTLFAHEDGYFLGSYVFNIGLTAILGVLAAIWMIAYTDMSVMQMQIAAVVLVVTLPLFLYPFCLSFWMALDLLIHPPGDFSNRVRT